MSFEEIRKILAEEATSEGITEYEIYFMETESIGAETLKDEISSFSSGVSGGVSFRCVRNGKMGYASTELFEERELRELVGRAAANALSIESDDGAVIFRGSEKYLKPTSDTEKMPDAAKVKDIALKLQKKTYGQSELVTDGTQSYVTAFGVKMGISNSYGLELSNSAGVCGAYVEAVVSRGGESEEKSDYAFGSEESDFEGLPESAVSGAIAKLGAAELESGRYDVIISGRQMKSMLSAFSPAFSAKNAQLGLSLLAGKEGSDVASGCVTIVDDPMREGCPMQTPFDGEGVATVRKNVIENGKLRTLLYDLSTAAKAGVASTGNGQRADYSDTVTIRPYNFYIVGGNISPDELRGCVKDGIYITELKGIHAGANAVTGDFSIESAGFRIKDGKLCGAVKSFTVAGNFFELLKNIEKVSDKVEFDLPFGFTVFGSPDVLIRGMSIAGK